MLPLDSIFHTKKTPLTQQPVTLEMQNESGGLYYCGSWRPLMLEHKHGRAFKISQLGLGP